ATCCLCEGMPGDLTFQIDFKAGLRVNDEGVELVQQLTFEREFRSELIMSIGEESLPTKRFATVECFIPAQNLNDLVRADSLPASAEELGAADSFKKSFRFRRHLDPQWTLA